MSLGRFNANERPYLTKIFIVSSKKKKNYLETNDSTYISILYEKFSGFPIAVILNW